MRYVLIFLIVSMSVSCKEEYTPIFKKEDFFGKWESVEIVRFNQDPQDCPAEKQIWEFTTDRVMWQSICEPNWHSGMTIDYTYEGKNIIVTQIGQVLEIIKLGAGIMKVDHRSTNSETYATITYKQTCKPVGASCTDMTTSNEMGPDICGKAGVANWICE